MCHYFDKLIYLLLSLLSASGQVLRTNLDDRCFLDGGGSTESFFVKESLPLGSLLGTLRVYGDPSRNIELRLQNDPENAVEIERRTKNLILKKSLDKEGIDGPSSLSFNVFCSRIGSDDPGFTIPVQIRVTDVNDNAPEFIGKLPYTLNISELTIVGSRVFQGMRATDKDQPGPFSTVEYSIQPGRFSDYLTFENPLEGSLVLTKHLDYESLRTFKVGIVARDQGTPHRETVSELLVTVLDADDQNPSFYYDRYEVLLPEQIESIKGQKLMVQPKDIKAYDKDRGLKLPVFYSFNSDPNNDNYKYFELNRNTGQIYVKTTIPENEILSPVTLVIKSTQFDNPDRYALTTLTVSRGGIYDRDLKFLQKTYYRRILENVPLNSVIVTLLTNKPSDRRVNFYVSRNEEMNFSVNQKGEVILRKSMDYENKESHIFEVIATDGRRNDSALVNISLLNINDWDPRFRYPQYEFFVPAGNDFNGYNVGVLDVHDGDKGDYVSLEVKGPYARAFDISNSGELSLRDISRINSSETHIVVVAEDSGIPPRRASVPVVVKFASSHQGIERGLTASIYSFLDENILLFLVFGLILSVCFLIICCLIYYICRSKDRRRKQRDANCILYNSSSTVLNDSLPARENQVRSYPKRNEEGSPNPLYEEDTSGLSGRSSSETLMSDPERPALNPMNPRSSKIRRLHTTSNSNEDGHLTRIQWPRNSIPRRVKKLSWEDELEEEENKDRDITTYTESPNISPMKVPSSKSSPSVPKQIGPTIYF
ncbi:unnamed protein product [Lepeophtheirus salmonis]|uniref:(salmon louse) hypothetical protein n=1 Tax=Lepeophtheirus salmonis TaxID=72036 RepID=A0A7R8CBK7_LEPSM|nr:unnamed protein product [Lepeophtheirus salmonis]CAF2760196.1 unnamed protein product [Lepeophtheirus salmonis]